MVLLGLMNWYLADTAPSSVGAVLGQRDSSALPAGLLPPYRLGSSLARVVVISSGPSDCWARCPTPRRIPVATWRHCNWVGRCRWPWSSHFEVSQPRALSVASMRGVECSMDGGGVDCLDKLVLAKTPATHLPTCPSACFSRVSFQNPLPSSSHSDIQPKKLQGFPFLHEPTQLEL